MGAIYVYLNNIGFVRIYSLFTRLSSDLWFEFIAHFDFQP